MRGRGNRKAKMHYLKDIDSFCAKVQRSTESFCTFPFYAKLLCFVTGNRLRLARFYMLLGIRYGTGRKLRES